MIASAFESSPLASSDDFRTDRRQRTRFRLACPIRLLRAGRRIGESRTRDINCESFSCILPDRHDIVRCGEVLECEIDLVTPAHRAPHAPPLLLRCQAMVLRVTALEHDVAEVVCRLLGYEVGQRSSLDR
jgi:hypothetical protein